MGSFTAAVEITERLVTNDPADDDLRRWLASNHAAAGSVLRRLGRDADAEDAWRRVAELLAPDVETPDRVDSADLETHAVALLRLGRHDDARPLVERLRARGWFEDSAGAELAELCRDLGWIA